MTTPAPRRDPLIGEGRPSSRLVAPPARTAIGNSIRTLLLVVVLGLIGVAIWWWRRPDDLTPRLGAREWVVAEIDGEPTPAGVASTFVLDGDGEARSALACGTSLGTWWFDRTGQRLELDWTSSSTVACPAEYPPTYRPQSGPVVVDGHTMTIETDDRPLRAVDVRGVGPADPDDFAGTWTADGVTVEVGQRGRFTVDDCEGTWSGHDDGAITISLDAVSIERGLCAPPRLWTSGAPLLPIRVGESLFLARETSPYPLDREIIRLDREPTSLVRSP